MQSIKYIYIVIIALLTSLLSGCGFHLRGPVTLPPSYQTVFIQSDQPFNDLSLQLRQALYEAGIKTMPTPDKAQLDIVIMNENQTAFVSSIASNSQISVSTVKYSVQFKVTDANNQLLLGPRTVTTSRTYSQNTNELLSVTNNLNILQHYMRADIVRQIIDQITAPKALTALDVSNS